MEAEALFWNMHVATLRCALCLILGRLFDARKDTLSVSKFLEETADHRKRPPTNVSTIAMLLPMLEG